MTSVARHIAILIALLALAGCGRQPAATPNTMEKSPAGSDPLFVKGDVSKLVCDATLLEWPDLSVTLLNNGSTAFSYRRAYRDHGENCFIEVFDLQRGVATRIIPYSPWIGKAGKDSPWLSLASGERIHARLRDLDPGLEPGTYHVRVGFPAVSTYFPDTAPTPTADQAYTQDISAEVSVPQWVPFDPPMDGVDVFPESKWKNEGLTRAVSKPVYSNIILLVIPPQTSPSP